VSAALAINEAIAIMGKPYTLLNLDEAVDVGKLHTVDWRRLHARLRKRIDRVLGEEVVVVGMGEVEYDETRNKWQPHYHLMVYGASAASVKDLRKRYYRTKRTGPRPMVRSPLRGPAKWFSYMSKLVAFGKSMETPRFIRRGRLNDELSREHFRYLADSTPTSFIFCINCSIVKQIVHKPPVEDDDEYEDEYQNREPHWLRPRFTFGGRDWIRSRHVRPL
jgi:hypothetical protein